MGSLIRRAARQLVVCSVVSLAVAAVALAARPGRYKGETSQRQPVSLKIAGGSIQGFEIVVLDKCPDGHTLSVTEPYPRMPIVKGRFGGDFAPPAGHPGQSAKLSGKLGRKLVTGSLQDTSYSPRERRLCHGSAKFTAKHV
ncbi:MAG TPA: hypothetical protein VGH24_05305 [Solirubrobacteraceae bacterium]|jgi:hypothetical protein